ncbi:FAD-dependent monooxygenase [Kribbella albertanoniae]|uniref:FAD-binding domain-containing protein n=1 Tax=Kribbella albertanoniae TaxID=1266829 RepID=A0A4R4Q7A1_9ACTN|nr:FAD-dependent monooxygenase [Kribbella albertanoniae]TDC30773.1 hypothetical protein E1261_12605 [Kribbella albertanoniae]
MREIRTQVVVAGAGPVGLWLAGELRVGGVDVLLIDQASQRTDDRRAGSLQSRTLEVFDQRGYLEPMLAAGSPGQYAHYSGIVLSLEDFDVPYRYALQLFQDRVERLLEKRVTQLGVRPTWGTAVIGLSQDADEVVVRAQTAEGEVLIHADYVVGCDGGHSAVRKLAGIGFSGTDPTLSAIAADPVVMDDPPVIEGFPFDRPGTNGHYTILLAAEGWYRVGVVEYDPSLAEREPSADELRAAMRRVIGSDFGLHDTDRVKLFGDTTRQADRYRDGRVLLAGDAAHVHFPAGGQGLNTGVQDAANLGWKLAAVVRGDATADLLDTYHTERHFAGEIVQKNTRAQVALNRPDEHHRPLRETMRWLATEPTVTKVLGGMISALALRYPSEAGGMAGMRLPDVHVRTTDGDVRLFELLRRGRPLLVVLTDGMDLSDVAEGWAGRIDLVTGTATVPEWTLPQGERIAVPEVMLVRPDGYVGWSSTAGIDGLVEALGTWCGPVREASQQR